MEVTLHGHIGRHQNIIEYYSTGEDATWRWIAMEYAEGGDLFDKIEADVGVSEEIAHLYFTQLVSGVAWMHSKGVGHRDIKPENILLSSSGDLKLADFGLATLYTYKGVRKGSSTMCGSPPYIAPEVINCSKSTQSKPSKGGPSYSADQVDIWSCGVVLFVLLVGNTPWDEPSLTSWEYNEFTKTQGHSSDDLWKKLPHTVLSLLRGMLKIDPESRFNFDDIRRHPWFTQHNPYLRADGKNTNALSLATKMLESLKIDFSQTPTPSQQGTDRMDTDDDISTRFASTQPETPLNDEIFDWERPPRIAANERWSASQPVASFNRPRDDVFDRLAEEPSMSQFSATPSIPLSLTQHARRFQDIVPSYSLTRFFSHLPHNVLLPLLSESLHRLGIAVPNFSASALQGKDSACWIKVKTVDGRHCGMSGDIVVDRSGVENGEEALLEVRFVKIKGDPLEWRRFFKKVCVLCKDAIFVPV